MLAASASDQLQPSPPAAPLVAPPRRLCEQLTQFADLHRWWIFAAIVLLYVAGYNGQWHVEPDSALYLSIARNLATGHGYSYHGQIAQLAYPGWPWLLAATFKVFGVGVVWPAHVLMLLMVLGSIALCYRLFLLHEDRATAVVVCAILAATQCLYQYAFQLRNDVPFLLGVMGVLAGYEGLAKRKIADGATRRIVDWALLIAGLAVAILMRPTMIPLLGALLAAVAWGGIRRLAARRGDRAADRFHHRPAAWLAGARLWRGVLIAILVIAALGVFILVDPRRSPDGSILGGYEQGMAATFTHEGRFTQTMADMWSVYLPQIARSVPTASFGIELGPGLNAAATILLLILGLWLWRRRTLWSLWIAATFFIMLFTLPRDRYFLPILPLLAFAWWKFISRLNVKMDGGWGNLIFCALLALWVAPNLTRIAGAAIAQHRTPFSAHYRNGEMSGIRTFAKEIPDYTPPGADIIADRGLGRILTYLGDRQVLDSWEFGRIDPAKSPVYCILPLTDDNRPVRRWIDEQGLEIGPAVLTVQRVRRLPPWRLVRLVKQPAANVHGEPHAR